MAAIVDNFSRISTILEGIYSGVPSGVSLIYQVLIIQRKKDGNDIDKRNIKNFYFSDPTELIAHKDIIVKYCSENNARAYINLNLRDNKNIALTMLTQLTDMLRHDNYKSIRTIYDSCYGQSSNNLLKKIWLIDIDVKAYDHVKEVIELIDFDLQPEGRKMVDVIPTLNGYHVLSHPFDIMTFLKEFPQYHKEDIKKDNPTLLYFESK